MASRSMVRFSRRIAVVLAALAVSVPALAGRADAAADPQADIYWSANPVTGNSVIGHIPRGTTATSFLYTGLAGAQAMASDGTYLYWSTPNVIWRAPLAGGAAPEQFLTGQFNAQAIAIDAPNGLIYWADAVTQSIGRTLLLPGQPVVNNVIHPLGGAPNGLAVDEKNGYLYWAMDGNATIGRAKVVGTPSIVVTNGYLSGLEGAQGVAVDGTYLYWANGVSGIGRAPLDGSSPPNGAFVPLAAVGPHTSTGSDRPTAMAVDAGYIYWANHRDYAIGQAPIGGGTPSNTFVRTLVDPTGIALRVQSVSPGPLPPPPPPTISALRTGVQVLGAPHGVEHSLLAKLDAAQRAADSGQAARACDSLDAFVNAVRAQGGKKIDEASAAGLVDQVTSLRQSLGCGAG